MRSTKASNLIREQVSFIYVDETCTHGLIVESSISINEGEPYHDLANLEVWSKTIYEGSNREKRGFGLVKKQRGGS